MKTKTVLAGTDARVTGLIARIALALVLLPHGCQLLLGWWGGFGFSASMNYFTKVEGLPWLIGFGVIAIQFFGALALLIGFAGRGVALAMIPLFIGMIVTSHWQHGLFMNWMGDQKGEGFEYHLLALGLCGVVAATGSGAFSVDALLSRNKKADRSFFRLPKTAL